MRGNAPIEIGPALLPDRTRESISRSQFVTAFHRDGRHFLKQVANRLGLDERGSIVVRHAAAVDMGEVVLRRDRLLVVLSGGATPGSAATLAFSAVVPGETVPEEQVFRTSMAALTNPLVQREFLDDCRRLLAGA
jgi:hypothetical protein